MGLSPIDFRAASSVPLGQGSEAAKDRNGAIA
jgi:hypothetical protein